MPEIPALIGRLGDEVVELRPIAEWDIPEILIAHQDDPRMYRRLGLAKPPSGAQLGSQVDRAEADRRAGRGVSLTLVEPGDTRGYCRGRIDLHALDWERRSAELGIWVAPRFRGRGFARHALALASGWLLDVVGLVRLELRTESDNEPLLRAAAAAGYRETRMGERVTLALTRSHGR